MAYEPYSEPRGRDPEVSQRAHDRLWCVWVWRPIPWLALGEKPTPWGDQGALPDSPWIMHTKCWHLAKVFGSKSAANRWVQRWQERRKRL